LQRRVRDAGDHEAEILLMSPPERMTAIEISSPGGPDVLVPRERRVPAPSPGEVLIKVAAAGVNRPDLLQRLGKYPPPPGASDVPGLEVSGTVAMLGPASGRPLRWREGDRVCALVAGGGYAEYCTAPAVQCLPVPGNVDMTGGAAIPETYFTVWTNLFQRGRLKSGETVLIHGGTSGIGTTAIQLAREFGTTVLATAGSEEKTAACARLGAVAINYRTRDFVKETREATSGKGVDIILDIVGGEYLQRNIEALAMNGRLLQIGLLGSARAEINLAPLMQKRLTITGSTLRVRTPEEKGAIGVELEARVWPLLAAGRVAPIVHRTFRLREAADAHRMLESGEVIGKLVLVV
jgi:putative PIG3 family NAD(P)H quinone oxidoreductase